MSIRIEIGERYVVTSDSFQFPSANQNGLPIRHTVQPMHDSHIFSIFLLKSKNTLSLLINMKRWPI